jgi:DNA-binding response OmpR family regulator
MVGRGPARLARDSDLPDAAGETVLLVEDDVVVRDMTGRMLTALGYAVRVAEDVHEALDVAQSGRLRVDLLVADVFMPGLNGFSLARQLLAAGRVSHVLLISGGGDPVLDQIDADLRSHVSVLCKPFSMRELAEKAAVALAD